jgi:hemolysin D
MTMASDAVPMVAEVTFLNKDIGLIAPGQRVKLKYDAFPFQDFGIQHGRLLHISPDVIMDERLGPVFRGRVALDDFSVAAKEATLPLRYGMMGVAEVVTDRQSILMRILSPLRKLQKTVEFSEVKEGGIRVGFGG